MPGDGKATSPATRPRSSSSGDCASATPKLLRSLTGSTFEYELQRPGEQVALRGDEARDALAGSPSGAFTRRYFREWWVATRGESEWWASAAGKPFWAIFFSALGGDATRVDVAVCLALEDDLIRRVVVVSAGPLSGRPDRLPRRGGVTLVDWSHPCA